MDLPPGLRWTLRVFMWIGLAFLYVPLLLVLLNAFNKSRTFAFPPTGLTLEWWRAAANSGGATQRAGHLDSSRDRGDSDRPGPRHHGGIRGPALPLLRPIDASASW